MIKPAGRSAFCSAPRHKESRPAGRERKQAGFTLLELLITIGIVGMLAGIAVPAMGNFIRNDRMISQSNALAVDLSLARSTAVTRHESVVLCPSDDNVSCSSDDWADGRIVFVDSDANSEVSAGEEIVSATAAVKGGNSVVASMGDRLIFDSRGFAPTTQGGFTVCDDRGSAHAVSIVVQPTGRITRTDTGSC